MTAIEDKARSLFLAALEHAPDRWPAFLDDACVADPAVGTGTFLLGVLRRIAATVEADQGEGAVPEAVEAAVKRLFAFEMQLGPFAVAQLLVLVVFIGVGVLAVRKFHPGLSAPAATPA